MDRSIIKSVCDYNIKNCFGFDEDDIDLFCHNTSVVNNAATPLEFQDNKPYRLALYVRPSDRKRLNTTSILSSTKKKSTFNKNKSCNNIMTKFLNLKEPRTIANNKKKNNVMLFDENTKPDSNNEKLSQENVAHEAKKDDFNILKSLNSSKKNVLMETNNKALPRSKQYKVRRSYERKCKSQKQEILIERSSSDIIKELELKKLSRTKHKKPSKEEQEFEKWAKDVNSDFSDVDKFELSITYD